MPQNAPSPVFDAVVVGSGATGGWAAKRLSEAGLKVALLDAGRKVEPREFTEHVPEFRLKYRNRSPEIARRRPVQKQCYACMEYNYDWFVDDFDNPYSTPPGMPFTWQRLRVVGGRTHVWGRQSYRLSDLDFKAASHDGYGEDWPVCYRELAPYYDIAEECVGISGAAERNPALPDGKFLPAMKMTCGEVLLRERVAKKFGWTVTIGRTANLTQAHMGRAACHYCGPCERGCATFSYFTSAFTTVADALKSKNCTLIPNAIVAKVDMDDVNNRALGVTWVDRESRKSYSVRAKTVILCAQALESTRILLNSSTRVYPNGLANSSGALGHYLMDHCTGGGAAGEFSGVNGLPDLNSPRRPNGIYIIRYRNVEGSPRHPRFIRGYGFQGRSSTSLNYKAPGFGAAYKEAVKAGIDTISLGAFGESLPRWDNYVAIDPNLRDAWGIPALHIHMTHGDNERALMEDAGTTAAEMLEAAGAKNIKITTRVEMPGMAIHELGTARMGSDPKKSVLDAWNQAHDVKNLFLMDGACFVSSACQNPTLTMMAICIRASDHLIDRFRRNEV